MYINNTFGSSSRNYSTFGHRGRTKFRNKVKYMCIGENKEGIMVNNIIVPHDANLKFDSSKELDIFYELRLDPTVQDLNLQVEIPIVKKLYDENGKEKKTYKYDLNNEVISTRAFQYSVKYIADFVFNIITELGSATIICDVKSEATKEERDYINKKKYIVATYHGCVFREYILKNRRIFVEQIPCIGDTHISELLGEKYNVNP